MARPAGAGRIAHGIPTHAPRSSRSQTIRPDRWRARSPARWFRRRRKPVRAPPACRRAPADRRSSAPAAPESRTPGRSVQGRGWPKLRAGGTPRIQSLLMDPDRTVQPVLRHDHLPAAPRVPVPTRSSLPVIRKPPSPTKQMTGRRGSRSAAATAEGTPKPHRTGNRRQQPLRRRERHDAVDRRTEQAASTVTITHPAATGGRRAAPPASNGVLHSDASNRRGAAMACSYSATCRSHCARVGGGGRRGGARASSRSVGSHAMARSAAKCRPMTAGSAWTCTSHICGRTRWGNV